MRAVIRKMKRSALYCVVLHVIECAVFILCDAADEKGGGGDAAITAALLLPGVSAAALCLFLHVLYPESGFREKWQYTLALAGVWFIVTGLAAIAAQIILGTDRMPIEQNQSGWENLLNGIEYAFFPVWNLIVGCGVLLLSIPARILLRKFRERCAAKLNR